MLTEKSLSEKIDEVQYYAQNKEKHRLERINNQKREAAKKLKESGNGKMLSDINEITKAFNGECFVDEIKLHGEVIFKHEHPDERVINAPENKEATQRQPRKF